MNLLVSEAIGALSFSRMRVCLVTEIPFVPSNHQPTKTGSSLKFCQLSESAPTRLITQYFIHHVGECCNSRIVTPRSSFLILISFQIVEMGLFVLRFSADDTVLEAAASWRLGQLVIPLLGLGLFARERP